MWNLAWVYMREYRISFTCFLTLLCLYLLNNFYMKHTGRAKKVNPKDIAKLGGTSLILGCQLKALESIGEGSGSFRKFIQT